MSDFAEKLVDRIARKPHGLLGRLLYRFPLAHKPGFDLVLTKAAPDADDTIVEVGCGGGVFMRRALTSGCRAVAVDHSQAMVDATARLNRAAVRAGRLDVVQADASQLPLLTATADKIYCLNAFFFFPDPEAALREMARVLKPDGILALVTAPPEMRDDIGGYFSRMAQSMQFYSQTMLSDMVLAAGLEPIEILQVPKAGLLMLARKR
ncbi:MULTISPECIES: class I SAM-dependent methyltransferase [unclassified Ochrobactrum]|uniref:class I SAM-dependent methyltransferase n=1 Tax=unclassified Ochrobactrum TaxID=239106 RepID=UPI0030AA5BFB